MSNNSGSSIKDKAPETKLIDLKVKGKKRETQILISKKSQSNDKSLKIQASIKENSNPEDKGCISGVDNNIPGHSNNIQISNFTKISINGLKDSNYQDESGLRKD